jgi:hypothetical protein
MAFGFTIIIDLAAPRLLYNGRRLFGNERL